MSNEDTPTTEPAGHDETGTDDEERPAPEHLGFAQVRDTAGRLVYVPHFDVHPDA